MSEQIYAIRTQEDIVTFLNESNYLHDGYILSVQFSHNGYKPQKDGSVHVYPEDNELKIRILITSIGNTVIELIFKEVSEWQVHDNMWDIFGTAISVSESGKIVWTDSFSTDEEIRKKGSYVVARSMEYRFCDKCAKRN